MISASFLSDLDEIALLARKTVKNLHDLGIDQWSNSYPLKEHFKKDYDLNGLFVYKQDNKVIASISILKENEEFYHQIQWQKSKSLVIHRLMVDPDHMRQKLGSQMILFAIEKSKKEGYESLKVDTHPDNIRMQNLLKSHGFIEIGYIKGMNRIGFELLL